jgi:hypothetical protein
MRKTRRSAIHRKTHKHKRSQHKRSQHKRSQHKRSQNRKNKRGGAGDCGKLYLECLKNENPSHGIYTPRPEPPTPPPRKQRSLRKPPSPPKEGIYEAYGPDKGTPYENAASHRSSSLKKKIAAPTLPKRNKMSPNNYGFKNDYVNEDV